VHSVAFGILRSHHNEIAHNRVTAYESVLAVGDSDYNRIVDNIVWGGFGTSLALSGDKNEVRRNVFINDSFFVVSMIGANDTAFVDNAIGASGRIGAPGAAKIEDSSRNRFVRNTIFSVPQGFDVRSGTGNVFRNNDLSGVPNDNPFTELVPDGVSVATAATGTVLRDNSTSGFDDDGIDVDAPGTRVGGNSANDNGDLGIEAVPGVVDLGGNTASGNGNPLQCTNVFCS
jgi:parallel beta-helix repeat protein